MSLHARSLARGEAAALDTSENRADHASEQELCEVLPHVIAGNIDTLTHHLNGATMAARSGNVFGALNELRHAGKIWKLIAADAKELAGVAEEYDHWPEPWPDAGLPDIAIWLYAKPESGLPGRSRCFNMRHGGLAALLSFAEYLEGRQ
jgi:hypothetical protein